MNVTNKGRLDGLEDRKVGTVVNQIHRSAAGLDGANDPRLFQVDLSQQTHQRCTGVVTSHRRAVTAEIEQLAGR